MEHIHWYPGHIAKAEKKLKEQVNIVDVVIEVLDARIPESSSYPDIEKLLRDKPRLILMNKSDLAELEQTKKWQAIIKEKTNCSVIATSANDNKDLSKIINKVVEEHISGFINFAFSNILSPYFIVRNFKEKLQYIKPT